MSEITRRGVLLAGAGAAASAATVGLVLSRVQVSAGPLGPTRERGVRTSFGTVALLASAQLSLDRAARASGHASGHGHGSTHEDPLGRGASATPVPSAVHGAWTNAVAVDVAVYNGSQLPIELSPGQFRVRIERGPTVSLYSSDRDAGPIGPGETASLRINYLAPPPDRSLSLEFHDAGTDHRIRLGRLDGAGAR